jgi:hypothetical protein
MAHGPNNNAPNGHDFANDDSSAQFAQALNWGVYMQQAQQLADREQQLVRELEANRAQAYEYIEYPPCASELMS